MGDRGWEGHRIVAQESDVIGRDCCVPGTDGFEARNSDAFAIVELELIGFDAAVMTIRCI